MSVPATTAFSKGGFSALKAVAPIFDTLNQKDGLERLGMAVAVIIASEPGCTKLVINSRSILKNRVPAQESETLARALLSLFGSEISENVRSLTSEIPEISENGSPKISEISDSEISENPFSPQTPLSEEERKKKRNNSSSSFFPSTAYKTASKEEWDALASELGIGGSEIAETAWRNYCENGPENIKYWRRYLTAYKANAEKHSPKRSEKFSHLADAFGKKTEGAK